MNADKLSFEPAQTTNGLKAERRRNLTIALVVIAALFIGLGVWAAGALTQDKKDKALTNALVELTEAMHYDADRSVTLASGQTKKYAQFFDIDAKTAYTHKVFYSKVNRSGDEATATLRHLLTAQDYPTLDYETRAKLVWVDGQWRPVDSETTVLPQRHGQGKLVAKVTEMAATSESKDGPLTAPGNVALVNRLAQVELAGKLDSRTVRQVYFADESGKVAESLLGPKEAGGNKYPLSLNDRHELVGQALVEQTTSGAAIIGIDTTNGDVLNLTESAYSATSMMGAYEPGPLFNLVTALAVLRSGLEPQSPLNCPASFDVAGRTYTNRAGYPQSKLDKITLKDAFAYSCETAFISAGLKLPWSEVRRAAKDLGMVSSSSTLFVMAVVPETLEDPSSRADALSGRLPAKFSCVSVAAALASIKAGQTVSPRVRLWAPTVSPAGGLTEEEAGQMRELLAHATDVGVTQSLKELSGGAVGVAGVGTDIVDRESHAWAAGYRGDLAVSVLYHDTKDVSKSSVPMLHSFFSRLD